MTPAHPDMFAVPDPESLIQLPWKPEVGWLASDLWMDGKPVAASPRVALKSMIEQARKQGYRMKTGVECEFFLIQRDGMALADGADTQKKPCYDAGALMPVRLPPGRAWVVTSPLATRSATPVPVTIGMVSVAARAAPT